MWKLLLTCAEKVNIEFEQTKIWRTRLSAWLFSISFKHKVCWNVWIFLWSWVCSSQKLWWVPGSQVKVRVSRLQQPWQVVQQNHQQPALLSIKLLPVCSGNIYHYDCLETCGYESWSYHHVLKWVSKIFLIHKIIFDFSF